MPRKTATFIKTINSRQQLFRLDPPHKNDWAWGREKDAEYEYVVSSFGRLECETYLFPADSEGNITNWGELPGSFRGGFDHEDALKGAGYTIINKED